MKAFLNLLLATLCLSAHLHAEEPVPVPAPLASHAESAESKPHAESAEAAEPGSPAGGAAERSEAEGVAGSPVGGAAERSEAEGVAGSPAGGAAERREAEGVSHAEPAERAEPAAPGGDAIQHSAFSTQHSPLSATVSLTDGSSLKGSLRRRFLPAESATLGRLRIDLSSVSSIAFEPDPAAAARVAFRNGDLVSAVLAPKHDRLVLDTLLGPVLLPLSAIAKIDFGASIQHSAFSIQHSSLLYHCTFDSPESIAHPAAGPAGRFLGGEFVPGKNGRALLVKARTPAAEVPFPTGLMQPEGCIEFWAKIPGATKETRYPDGGNPQFFAMGVGKWVNTFVKYTANDGFGTGGLHADLPGSAYVSSLPSWGGSAAYPDFLGDPAAWHHYALVWSEKGLDAASEALGRRVVSALYVDGRLVNPAYGTNGPDRARFLREFADEPVVLGFPYPLDRKENNKNDVDYLIDEFKIWSAPKTDFAIPPAAVEPPRLLYHCTFDDSAAIERPAAGPSGTFLGGTFEEGKAGNALRVRKGLSSAIVRFEKGVLRPRGTIEFWAKIENDREHFGDGGDPRFFMMETAPGSETVFQLAANDGCGRGGLSIYHQGLSAASEDHCLGPARYDSVVPGATKGWHHYALVWDETGVPGPDGPVALAAFVDGRRIPLHGDTGLAKAPRMAARFRDNPATLFLSLNPELDRGFNNKTDFLIDEFKIWSAPKTAFDIR